MHKTFNAKCNLAKVCVHVCVCVWVQVHDLSVCIIKNVWWKKCSIFYLFTYIMLLYTVCSMHIALAHKLFFCHVLFYFFFCMCVLPAVLLIIFSLCYSTFFFYYLSMYTSQLCIFCAFLCTCGLWYPVSYYRYRAEIMFSYGVKSSFVTLWLGKPKERVEHLYIKNWSKPSAKENTGSTT